MMSHEYTTPNQNRPPRDAATDAEDGVYSVATGAAASEDIWANYTADASGNKAPPGKVWIELEATGATAYVRFTRTATTATTAANGAAIVVGSPRRFYLDPSKDLFMDHFCATAGVLKWRRVGPIGERSRA